MSISIRSSSKADTGGLNGATITVPVPTGVINGDVMVMLIEVNSTTLPSIPAGWTALDSSNTSVCVLTAYRVASSEPASYNVVAAHHGCVGIVAYSGVDNSTPVNAHGAIAEAASSTIATANSITTTVAGCMLLLCGGFSHTSNPLTYSGGFAEVISDQEASASMAIASLAQVSAGATGSQTITSGSLTTSTGGTLVALQPAAGSPPANTVLPAVTGTVGSAVISTTNGTWTGSPTSYSYQWQKRGSNITGATSATYTPTSDVYGYDLTCVVTASNASGSTSATSNVVTATAIGQTIYRGTDPLLAATVAWENSAVEEPSLLIDSTEFKMYFTGGWASPGLGVATCPLASDPSDPANWTKSASNPLLGQGGSSFAGAVQGNNVFKVGSTYYCFFYSGNTGPLHVSTSTDGLSWTTPASAIPSNQVAWSTGWYNSYVWGSSGAWKMLLTGSAGSGFFMAYATSAGSTPDAAGWQVQGTGPLANVTGGPWLASGGSLVGGAYRLFEHATFTGVADALYIAHATDPQSWTADGVLLVPHGSIGGGATEQAADPSLLETGGKLYLYYSDVNNTAGTSNIQVATFPSDISTFVGSIPTLSTIIGKTGTSGTAVMQKAKTGWTYVAGKTGGTATAIAQKTLSGWTKIQGH